MSLSVAVSMETDCRPVLFRGIACHAKMWAENLRICENFYISVVIYSKSILYKIHIASKKQIRNKTVFFDNSVFFSFHLISFFALGNI